MEENKYEKGYLLFDVVIAAFLLLTLVSYMYFLKINGINRMNCRAAINAEYLAQYYMDRLIYLGEELPVNNIEAGGIVYTIKEEKSDSPSQKAELIVSWKINGRNQHVSLQRSLLK